MPVPVVHPSIMSLADCIRRWPTTTRSPCVTEFTFSRIGFQDGRTCLFYLEEEGVILFCHKERHATPGPYTPDTDNLVRNILQMITVKQHPAFIGQGFAIRLKCLDSKFRNFFFRR